MRLALYKSAAELTVRLLPRRHPLAALAGAAAKRTPRTNRPHPTGLPKSIEELFGKRSRNGAKQAYLQRKAARKAKFAATRKRGGREAVPLTRLGSAFAFPAAHRFLPCPCCVLLCYLREPCDHFRARLPDELSVNPAPEAVKEQELSVL